MKIFLFGYSLQEMINFRGEVIKFLAEEYHKVIIVCAVSPKYNDYNFHNNRIEVRHINFCRSMNIWKSLLMIFQYAKFLRKDQPDLIFNYSVKACLVSMLISWRTKNFFVITGRGSALTDNLYKFLVKFLIKFLNFSKKLFNKQKNNFIFLNKDDMKYFIDHRLCLKEQVLLLPGEGVNLNYFEFTPINESIKKINSFLFVGRLIKEKGILELIEACRIMKASQIKFTCTVIAPIDKENASALQKIDLDLFKEVGINYLSFQHDIRPFIIDHDIMILPSYGEGLPRFLLEGMAIGRPIITTDTQGCRELVNEGRNGFLVNPKDPKLLFNKMKKLATMSKKELNNLGLVSYHKVKNFYSSEKVIKAYKDIL